MPATKHEVCAQLAGRYWWREYFKGGADKNRAQIECVLLLVLWVRSYWRWDYVESPICSNGFYLNSFRGRLGLDAGVADSPIIAWSYSAVSLDSFQTQATIPQPISCNDMNVSVSVSTTELPRIVSCPHGFAVLLFATLAVAPWIRRFTLRTLLIATTLVAVVLGLIVWAVR